MNKACGLNLLLVMAMCKGWYLSKILWPLQQTPVWGLIGPTEDVWDTDLLNATSAYYTELFSSLDGKRALDAMNQAKPITDWDYKLQTAELLYCKVINAYVRDATPEELRARENWIVEQHVRNRGGDITAAFEARLMAREILADHRRVYEYYREHFLMLNLFPDNKSRFKLGYDDCLAMLNVGA